MIGQFLENIRELLFLTRDTRQNKEDIESLSQKFEALHEKVRELASTVEALRQEIRYNAQTEKYERERIVMQLENTLLCFERHLPPGS